jgi:hypothetical protein
MIEQIITNLFTAAVLMAILGFFIKRWMDNLEAKINILGTDIGVIRSEKLDKTECDRNHVKEDKEQSEVWNWLKYHAHTTDGHVIVPQKD